MSRFSLQGRVAVVTGGGRGIGYALAQGLAEAGASVAIFDTLEVSSQDLEGLSFSQQTPHALSYKVDVTSLESLQAGFAAVKRDFAGKLDILVACAGINRNISLLEMDESNFDALCGVNFKGVYFSAQLAAKAMIDNGTKCGSMILIASIASYVAPRGQSSTAYCGTKGAVRAMVPPIAVELAAHDIRVNSISPGYVKSAMTDAFVENHELWKSTIISNRLAEPDEMKGACVFLASDASKYCTGTDILVDGGVVHW